MARFNDQVQPQNFESAAQYVESLQALTEFNGEIISAKELRYIDVEALELIEENLSTLTQTLSQATADFLQKEQALAPYYQQIDNLTEQVNQATSITELSPISDEIAHLVAGLELLNHIMLSLDIEDSRQRTKILEDISAVFGQVNRVKAEAELAKKKVGSEEAKAEFGARFKLLSQSVTSALNASDSPEACDKQLSSLLVQLEEFESQFSDYDEFYQEILVKRDEIYDNFEQHKQQLVDQRQRRCANLMTAAERIVQSITRRASTFKDTNKLNSYFAADPMITKLRQLIEQLRSLDDNVRADDLAAKLKNAKEQGIRALRDKTDIYSDDGSLVKIGDYQFSVNNQALELTLLPREQQMMLHIIGSDYYQALDETLFENTQHLWQQNLVSESLETYRAEYLAASILFEAESKGQVAVDALVGLAEQKELAELIRVQAEARYQEGYDKGVHDVDAAAILTELLRLKSQVGLLAYSAEQRLLAIGYLYLGCDASARQDLIQRCQNLALMTQAFGDNPLRKQLINELTSALADFCQQEQWLAVDSTEFSVVADYLLAELANGELIFVIRKQSKELLEDFQKQLANKGLTSKIMQALAACKTAQQQYQLHFAWLSSYCQHLSQKDNTQTKSETDANNNAQVVSTEMMVEVCSVLLFNGDSSVIVDDASKAPNPEFYALDVDTTTSVPGLLGQHKRINDRSLVIDYQSFINRLRQFSQIQVPAFKAFHQLKQEVLEQQRKQLRLHEFMPSALSSFVRNKLINDVYFPIIGANLAKQIGAAGADKRSDLMGLLLLISPPGYGKTTLIEYVASKLGMTFVKINCPSIGHEQVSLDPCQATNSTARSEVEKINLAFEMGNNVMLYLDDIQHTNPEFLQKFISLCDGSRKVDGVWNGESKTYDMRGKKFAVVMAGNPYTESGEAFTIPDMLANRADIYNLGDTLSGREHEFSLSFIENSLTSNPYLAPLAMRDMEDLYQLVKLADDNSVGEEASASNLKHGYSQAEVNEIVAVIKRIRHIQKTVLKANEQYIKSAAQDDKYRTEPPFKLQGSYRNMNKMAEKVVPVMTEQELEQLIGDHYRGEAQTLTVGAEENLLKLAELRDTLTSEQAQRWQQIKSDYARHQSLGDEEDSVKAIANQIALLKDSVNQIAGSINPGDAKNLKDIENTLASLQGETNDVISD
ncbi:AAA family ATPase [Endozoicomonas sp. G2_1]|uniref:DUF7902 domain-containing protein n=1 Tax=Endozoicomonas sp. G2_1 TaxID=2821091 RepID=UPI001ADC50C0|nr:AAA family ATPase [Endozoicomonas sp. G2_1]